MDAKTLAVYLLIGRILSLIVIGIVLRKQVEIFRGRPDPELRQGRIVMMFFAMVLLLGNFIPVVIDIAVIHGDVTRANPSPAGIAYAFSSNLVSLFSSCALLALYIIAEKLLKPLKGRK
jgi:hypothetical protein